MRSFLLLATLALPLPAQAESITVFAAASMKTALDVIGDRWEAESGNDIHLSYAGSSALARQIMQGAPANVFISASTEWMDAVEAEGLVADDTRQDLLGNTLVIVGPKGSPKIDPVALPEALGESWLAMALVEAVPAGIYGRQALTSTGIWDEVSSRVAQAEDVRGALALVAVGEAHYGVVYASDAVAEPRVDPVATFPADTHDPIVYPAALIEGHVTEAAADFLDYLGSPRAADVFRAQGFEVLD